MVKIVCPYLKGNSCDNKQNGNKKCKFIFPDCLYYQSSKLPKNKVNIGKRKSIKG